MRQNQHLPVRKQSKGNLQQHLTVTQLALGTGNIFWEKADIVGLVSTIPRQPAALERSCQQEQSISQLPDVSLLQLSEFFRSLLQSWSALIAGG